MGAGISCSVGTPNTLDEYTLFALRWMRERDIDYAAKDSDTVPEQDDKYSFQR
jgi:hypothetical protein